MLLMLRRAPEADALLAETGRTLAQPTAIVTPATAFLAPLSTGLQNRAPADPLGWLKTLLLGPALPRAEGVAQTRDVDTLLTDLTPALPESWHACLAALEAFPLWRDTPPVPLITPWPDAGG